MKKLSAVLILLLFASCLSSRKLSTEQVIGKYHWNGIYGVASNIELSVDHTFEYNWQAGLSGGTTLGTWTKEGSKITLDSDQQPSEVPSDAFEIVNASSTNSNLLCLKIVNPENEPLPFVSCGLVADTTVLESTVTDFNGEAKLPRFTADSLVVSFVGYRTIELKLDNSISHYELRMKEQIRYYKFFTNEVWKLKRGRLYNPSIEKSKSTKKDYYEKAD
ncbi:carboxypeptidase-like regulatory domain-containing protein [Chitinophagales bacterium]|nr:carboxypeptidase-like regulatory domain-containing protein [Chitinophagales bacterium]